MALRPSRFAWLCMALGAMALAAVPAVAANAPIYKCFDAHLNLVYTDVPCKDGEQLDIRAGNADPAAVARLDRALDRLDQSVAQRIQDERRAAEARPSYAWSPPMTPAQGMADEPDYDYNYNDYNAGYGYYYPFERAWRHPRPHRPHQTPGVARRVPHLTRMF